MTDDARAGAVGEWFHRDVHRRAEGAVDAAYGPVSRGPGLGHLLGEGPLGAADAAGCGEAAVALHAYVHRTALPLGEAGRPPVPFLLSVLSP